MDTGRAKARLRSFAFGGLVGASAALAAARRRRLRRARTTPPGLVAFEEAPCYRELLAHEAEEEARQTGEAGGGSDRAARAAPARGGP